MKKKIFIMWHFYERSQFGLTSFYFIKELVISSRLILIYIKEGLFI